MRTGSGSSHPSSHDSDRPPMGRSRNPAHHLQFVYSHESDSGAGIGDDTVDHTCQTDQETVTNIPKNARTFAYPGGEALL